MLSDSEGSDVESLHELTINEHYAKAFEYKKEREELQKLKEKYGSDFEDDEDGEESSDSESDESEDEDGEELTPTVDAAILRTLARIKRRDPEIYDAEKNIFGEEQDKVAPIAKVSRGPRDKSKPVTMRQVALESALNPDSRSPSPEPLPHVEEQRALRDETIAAFHHAVGDEDGEDGLFIPREKTTDEREREEEEYRAFLEREVGGDLQALVTIDGSDGEKEGGDAEAEVSDGEKTKEKKKKKKKKKEKEGGKDGVPEQSRKESDQEFLMNYILNRGWIDRSANHVPTYREITSSNTKGKTKQASPDPEGEGEGEALPTADPELNEEDFEEIVDRFESSYNFRFEEPDAAVIKSFPRTLPSLVRREDTTRKEARERRKQRKEEELAKRKEEVKRLKGLKMKEIRAKLEKIGREGGKDADHDLALRELDLDGEWDPEAHDRQMAGLYGDDGGEEEERPQWDDDIDIGDIPISDDDEEESHTKKSKKKKKKKKDKESWEEAESLGVDIDAMDADVERIVDDEEWDGTEEMRKRKLDEYMDEIYGLDFNDLVGDLPTRFKYVPVPPQNFALTPAEILMATDQELNEYVSVKKYAPYRKEVRWDSTRNDRLRDLKAKVAERAPGAGVGSGSGRDGIGAEERPVKKRKGKKERQKRRAGGQDGDGGEDGEGANAPAEPLKRKREVETADEPGKSPGQEDGQGKKKRRRKKKEGALGGGDV